MDYIGIQRKLDYGRAKEASKLGPPWNVYRLTNQDSDGNTLITENLIRVNYRVRTKVAYGAAVRNSFEGEREQGILWYEIVADMGPFLVGDVFVLNDLVYGAGSSSVNFPTNEYKGFALADHSPIKKSLGGRLNLSVNIFRLSKVPDGSGNWNNTATNDLPVVLSDGVFSLGAKTATPCLIPAGLIATGKSYGDRMFDQKPGDQRRSGWELYLPALNGFDVREGDRVITQDGARYQVIVPYTQKVGATGSQWFLEREISQPG